jgi:hypothetical protein
MKKSVVMLSVIALALICAGCGDSSGGGDDEGDPDASYSFEASYDINDSDAAGHGSVYVYKDGVVATATTLSLDGTSISTSIPVNNTLTAESPGASIPLTVAVGGRTYTGSAILPDLLSGVDYVQSASLPIAGGAISVDETIALDIEWENMAVLAHPAARVRVEIKSGPSLIYEDDTFYAMGRLTVPANTMTSGDFIYVYGYNAAADIAPTTQLDTAKTVFRAKNGTMVTAN